MSECVFICACYIMNQKIKLFYNYFQNELAGLGGDIGFIKNEIDMQVNLPLPADMVSGRWSG